MGYLGHLFLEKCMEVNIWGRLGCLSKSHVAKITTWYLIRKESNFNKKMEGRNTTIDRVCMVQFIHLKNQNYRVKNVFFIPKARMLLRYKWCIVVAEKWFPLFLLFGRKYLRWFKKATSQFADPELSGPILVILKLLFRGYYLVCKGTIYFLKCKILLFFRYFQNSTLLDWYFFSWC